MTLKLPASEDLGNTPEEFTLESIDQLIAEAKKGPVENARLLSALEFMSNEAKRNNSPANTTDNAKLVELLTSAPVKKLGKNEREELESDLTNGSIEYVQTYIKGVEDSEKRVVALNVLLKKLQIIDAKITSSPAKGCFYYTGNSGYPIEFSFKYTTNSTNYVSYSFPKIGTGDKTSLMLIEGFVSFSKVLQVIDKNILLTSSMIPFDEKEPFKYAGGNKIVFITNQKNFLGKPKRIKIQEVRLEEDYYSTEENAAVVTYLNNHRRVFSSGIFQKNEQESNGSNSSQGSDNLMLV